jgi:hypothetical protein
MANESLQVLYGYDEAGGLPTIDPYERSDHMIEHPAYEYINASRPERIRAIAAVAIAHQDALVKKANQALYRTDEVNTVIHQFTTASLYYILNDRVLEAYENGDAEFQAISNDEIAVLKDHKSAVKTISLHDVGKSDGEVSKIIKIDGELTDEQHAIVARHVEYGVAFIYSNNLWAEQEKHDAATVVESHHVDQRRNPYGVKATGRLQAIAENLSFVDQLEALTAGPEYGRPYTKKGMSGKQIIAHLEKEFTGQGSTLKYGNLLLRAAFDADVVSLDQYSAGTQTIGI